MRAIDAPHFWIEAKLERRDGWDGERYPFNLPVVRRTDTVPFHPKATFLVGENGSGKSTLIEAFAGAWGLNPEGGSRNFNFATRASHSELHRFIRPVRGVSRPRESFFLRAESFFNLASEIERLGVDDSYGMRSLHEQSHGESFFALFESRLTGQGLYIFDEPEAALSPSRQLSFLARMNDLIRDGSQFIIATHSPIILGYPEAWIYQASEHGLERIAYEDAEQVQVTRHFLNHREAMLRTLLDDE